jgi:hypothetical protein
MKTYTKDNKEHYLCLVRQELVLAQPEETARQKMLHKLINEMKVPVNRITVENELSRFQKGAKGNIDIIVWYAYRESEADELGLYPLLIILCKDATKSVESETYWDQLYKYNETLGAYGLAVVNGEKEIWHYWSDAKETYYEVQSIPTYPEILAQENIELKQ